MTVFKTARRWVGALAARAGVAVALRLHRDERGGLLEYAFTFGFIAVFIIALFYKIFHVLTDYFGLFAFFVTWPFI